MHVKNKLVWIDKYIPTMEQITTAGYYCLSKRRIGKIILALQKQETIFKLNIHKPLKKQYVLICEFTQSPKIFHDMYIIYITKPNEAVQ